MGACNLIPVEVAKRYQAVPVGFMPDRSVLLAMVDPSNVLTLDEISMITGRKVRRRGRCSRGCRRAAGPAQPARGGRRRVRRRGAGGRPRPARGARRRGAGDQARLRADRPGGRAGGLGHPLRSRGRRHARPLPDRRDSRPRRHDRPGDGAGARLPDQDHGEHGHRRAPRAAGRAAGGHGRRSPGRRARRDAPAGPGRGRRDADPGQRHRRCASSSRSGMREFERERVSRPRSPSPTARSWSPGPPAREVDHAVCGARPDQRRPAAAS